MNTRATRASVSICVAAIAIATLFTSLFATAAGAAPSIGEPHGSPYVVKLDAQGKPVPFTVVAKGFPPGSLVYVEQCNGRPPTAPNWLPTRDCDIGSSPAAAIADATGTARFPAGDLNHGFPAFVGLGPEGLFHCLTPDAKPTDDGLAYYRTCQIRVSSNNNVSTTDQVFQPIAFGSVPKTPTSAGPGPTPSSSSSSGSSALAVGGVVLLLAVGLLSVFVIRRRKASTPA